MNTAALNVLPFNAAPLVTSSGASSAIRLNGIDNTLQAPGLIDYESPYEFGICFRWDSTDPDWSGVFDIGKTADGDNQDFWEINGASDQGEIITVAGGTPVVSSNSGTPPADTWVYISFLRTPTQYQVLIDGTLAASCAHSAAARAGTSDGIWLGSLRNIAEFLKCDLAFARAFPFNLTAAERAAERTSPTAVKAGAVLDEPLQAVDALGVFVAKGAALTTTDGPTFVTAGAPATVDASAAGSAALSGAAHAALVSSVIAASASGSAALAGSAHATLVSSVEAAAGSGAGALTGTANATLVVPGVVSGSASGHGKLTGSATAVLVQTVEPAAASATAVLSGTATAGRITQVRLSAAQGQAVLSGSATAHLVGTAGAASGAGRLTGTAQAVLVKTDLPASGTGAGALSGAAHGTVVPSVKSASASGAGVLSGIATAVLVKTTLSDGAQGAGALTGSAQGHLLVGILPLNRIIIGPLVRVAPTVNAGALVEVPAMVFAGPLTPV